MKIRAGQFLLAFHGTGCVWKNGCLHSSYFLFVSVRANTIEQMKEAFRI